LCVQQLIKLLKVAPKHHGNVIVNRNGQQVIHKKILQQGSSFSSGGGSPKTCLELVVNAPSAYEYISGKQQGDLQHVQQGG
jgi:hypothetical protein